jgi:hypothetical protein
MASGPLGSALPEFWRRQHDCYRDRKQSILIDRNDASTDSLKKASSITGLVVVLDMGGPHPRIFCNRARAY